MTSVAPDTDQLQELDAETRQAWATYRAELRELSGEEYEQAETESWEALQTELRRLEKERESLAVSSAQIG